MKYSSTLISQLLLQCFQSISWVTQICMADSYLEMAKTFET